MSMTMEAISLKKISKYFIDKEINSDIL